MRRHVERQACQARGTELRHTGRLGCLRKMPLQVWSLAESPENHKRWIGKAQRLTVAQIEPQRCREIIDGGLVQLQAMPLKERYRYQCDRLSDARPVQLQAMPLAVLYLA